MCAASFRWLRIWLPVLAVSILIVACSRNAITITVDVGPELASNDIQIAICDRRISADSVRQTQLVFESKIDCEGMAKLIYGEQSYDLVYITTGLDRIDITLSFDGNSVVIRNVQIQ
jgi:hypothetical protein